MSEDLTTEPNPLKGGAALMLKINRHPGWEAVVAQAVDCGMEALPLDQTHLTVVFFGRNLSPKQADDARDATRYAMRLLAAKWKDGQIAEMRKKGILEVKDEELHPAFIPVRFPGDIGQFQNKSATHVHAVALPSPTLLAFRKDVIEAYGHKVPADFGGVYRPHVSLAEGPAGTSLKRDARVPSGATNAGVLMLKLGTLREIYTF